MSKQCCSQSNVCNEVKSNEPNLCEGGNECVDLSDYCEEEKCQACCPHNEFDHNICLDCEREFDVLPGYDEDYGQER
jgi:hypothetical protein